MPPDDQSMPEPRRTRDADQTRRDILDAAIAEFSEKGFAGGRVDDIAARTRTTKRMIYYYFRARSACSRRCWRSLRRHPRCRGALALAALAPAEAMRKLVETTFDHHAAHPEFVRLVSVENILEARNVAASETVQRRNAAVIGVITEVLSRGMASGAFRPGIDPLDLHMLISGFCFYRVSNRHTLGAIFGRDLRDPAVEATHRRMAVEMVLRYLAPG